MEKVIEIFNLIMEHGPKILAAIVLIVNGVIAICLLIPGSEPESTLQKIVDFLSKFSRKSPENPESK